MYSVHDNPIRQQSTGRVCLAQGDHRHPGADSGRLGRGGQWAEGRDWLRRRPGGRNGTVPPPALGGPEGGDTAVGSVLGNTFSLLYRARPPVFILAV